VTSNLDPSLPPSPAPDASPAESAAGAAPDGAAQSRAAGPRRAREALLKAGVLVATTAAVAAFEPKFPKLVGD
jgi:hypothetical protein